MPQPVPSPEKGGGLYRQTSSLSYVKHLFAKNPKAQPRIQDGLNGLRRKQRKRYTNIGCWNIQGISSKEVQVFRELHSYNIDIAVLTETKKKGQGNKYIDDYIYFWSGVEKTKRAKSGVIIAIKKKLETSITSWNPVNDRILTVDLKVKGRKVRILGIYAPTDDSDMTTKDEFFDKLSEEIDNSKNQEIILLGDYNGRVGKALDSKIIGQHGEDVVNNNGTRWIELCEEHSLKILNGFFQHKEINKYTWIQKTKNLRSILDYIAIKQNSVIRPKDVKVWRGAECGSDHLLVKSVMDIKYSKEKSKKDDQTLKSEIPKNYNLDSLRDESTSFLYKLRLAQKLKEEITGTAQEMYEMLKQKLHKSAMEALGEKERRSRNFWWTGEIAKLVEEKKKLYFKWLASKDTEDQKQYNRYKYIVKKEVKRMKNEAWSNKCAQISSMVGGSRSREAWKTINNLRKNTNETKKINPLKAEVWKEYYSNLLTESRKEYLDTKLNKINIEEHVIEEITIEEVKRELQKMKNNKAPGPGDLPIELLKHATNKALEILCSIFNKCLFGETLPQDWKLSNIISIYKKGDRNACENYRGISITSSTGRLYGRILKTRIEKEADEMEEQSGFRPGRSCTDNIFTLRNLAEKYISKGRELHLTFIDLRKAFDSVPLQKLWTTLEEQGVNARYINAIKTLYKENLAVVKVGNQTSTPFRPTKGVKQGCCLSPTLFKIYLRAALKNWSKKCSPMGVRLRDSHLHTILFADDQVIIAEDEEDMKYMLTKLIEEYNNWGLEVNTEKTKYLLIGGKGQDLELDNGAIKSVEEYEYLGVTVCEDGRDDKDIIKKVGKGKNMTKALHPILWNNNITKKTKTDIYKTLIESVMTYGSEVWVMDKNMKQKLLSAEMSYWRRCCSLTLFDKIRNEEIRERMEATETIIETINTKQLKWYGHLQRMSEERIPKKVWNWTPPQRNKRGRPRKKWVTNIKIEMEKRGLQEEDWKNKKIWRFGCEKRR